MSARSLNRVTLIGNLTRDPELRYTPSGTAVCTIGLATNRSWAPNDGGERQEETEFHRLVAWAKLAEICAQLLYKGRKVYIEGRLQTRKWTGNQDGVERETTEVVVDNMIALGAPKGGGQGGGYSSYSNNSNNSYGDSQQQNNDYQNLPASATDEVSDDDDDQLADDIADATDDVEDKPKKEDTKKVSKKSNKKEKVDADDIPF